MRLHRLSLDAVGPFATAQEVDFDALGTSGMFLLEGPTGAGKSTVLDAVTFALYGTAPRRDCDPQRMHSHYAAPGVRPHVELEFSVGGRRYLIARTPRYERAKRRGTGTLAEEPTVRLARRDCEESWVEVTHDNAEAGTLIGDILGLSRDQFAQVVVLPQGQFAKFLQADDDQRRGLLTRLFGTELFDQVTEHVGERAKAARAELADVRSRIATSLAAALEAGEIAEPAAARLAELVPGGEFELQTLSQQLADHAGKLEAAVRTASRAQDRISRRLTRLERVAATTVAQAARLARLVSAHQACQAHEITRADRDRSAAELDAGRRAEPLGVVLKQATSAQSRAGELAARVRVAAGAAARLLADPMRQPLLEELLSTGPLQEYSLRDELSHDESAPTIAVPDVQGGEPSGLLRSSQAGLVMSLTSHLISSDLSALSGFGDRLREIVASITPLAATERAIADVRAEMDRLRDAAEAARARMAANQSELLTCQMLNGQLRVVQAEALRCAGEAAQLHQSQGIWSARLSEAVRSQRLRSELEEASSEAVEAIDAHQRAVAEHQARMAERIAGMRAELAGLLVEGQACMVCGATEHPSPADRVAMAVTEQQLRDAATRADVALERRRVAEMRVATVRELLAAATAGTGGFKREEIQMELERIAVDLDQVSRARDVISDLRSLELDWANREVELAAAIAADSARAAQCDGEYSAQAAGLAAVEHSVAQARGTYQSVSQRVSDLTRLAAAVADLHEARSDQAAAIAHLDQLTNLVERESRRCGFTNLAELQSALRGPQQLAALATAVSEWDTRAAELSGQLQAPDLAGLDPLDSEQAEKAVEAARVDLAAAGEAARTARAEAMAAHRKCQRFTACQSEVNAAIADLRSLETNSAGLAELDRLVRGLDGRKRMTLTTFVLRYWFVQVVAAANLRLATMSTGKYELVHSEVGDSRRDRVGLGLTVLDRHTGQERSTRSLSGGETFYTSLALALGLSDVVAAQAGGVSLDTLFIDEGFGTLDPQTLEEVMAVLDELRGNGRVVGVVSHMAELKERIPERIEVRRERPDGPSRLHIVA